MNLDRTYATGETVTVSVTYSGNPAGESFGWDSHGGQPMIWTLSEPFGARDWWPCKDVNNDKADSVDIRVTVPDNLIVASNGLLVSDVDNGATRTFHWHTDYPIATYLVSLAMPPLHHVLATGTRRWPAATRWRCSSSSTPTIYDDVQATYALTVPMIEAFAQGFGEYPFVDEKYGHAEFTWGGGMEHQTFTSLGGWSEDLISHELAHQWWGDMITCADFDHIWLNEGFATWGEAYWKEQTDGLRHLPAVHGHRRLLRRAARSSSRIPLNDNIFDGNLSYNKGSWVVHMLRGVLGDDGLLRRPRRSTARTYALRQRHHRAAARRHGSGERPRPRRLLPAVDLRRVLPGLQLRLDRRTRRGPDHRDHRAGPDQHRPVHHADRRCA